MIDASRLAGRIAGQDIFNKCFRLVGPTSHARYVGFATERIARHENTRPRQLFQPVFEYAVAQSTQLIR